MRVLITTVKQNSAIDRLAQGMVKYLPHIETKILPVHPKRPSTETLSHWQNLAKWADVLDFQYWKNAEMLLGMFPDARSKPKVLTHHNPYDLDKSDWNHYQELVVKNETQSSRLPRAKLLPHTIDLKYFKWNPDYTKEKVVGMVAGRIEGKKGVEEVAKVCQKLGYKMLLIGRVSEPTTVRNILKNSVVDFREAVSEEDLYKAYTEMAVLVCNSEDNFESGPLPVLEAMAVGVPVLSREVGLVPDINNGKNIVVRKGDKKDYDDLEKELKDLMESTMRRERIREAGWESVKNKDERRTAIQYEKIWHRILHKEPLVSVIVTTADRPEALTDCLSSILTQDYPSYEIIVCDDGDKISVENLVKSIRKKIDKPIKYVRNPYTGRYGLSEARNRGIIESLGEILVFCDDRLEMDSGALTAFAENAYAKKWNWGEKDGAEKGFVENFSSCMRKDIVQGGLFNEMITTYGGITQDIRTRFERFLGEVFAFVPEAKAKSIAKSGSRWRKKQEIIDSKTLLWKLYDQ